MLSDDDVQSAFDDKLVVELEFGAPAGPGGGHDDVAASQWSLVLFPLEFRVEWTDVAMIHLGRIWLLLESTVNGVDVGDVVCKFADRDKMQK